MKDMDGRKKQMTKKEILAVSLRQSAIDFSCAEEDFLRDVNVVTESKPAEGASRYMKLPHICALASYGNNVVAACRGDLIPEVEAFVNGQEKNYRCFETPQIYELNRILRKAGAQICWMHTVCLPDPDEVLGADLSFPY